MTRILLLPFCCDGYDEVLLREQAASYRRFLEGQGFSVTAAAPVRSFEAAREAAETFHPYRFDLPVLFPVTWSDPSLACTAARAFFGRPLLIQSVNEFRLDGRRTEFSSVPASLALAGCLREADVPCELLTGPWDSEENVWRLNAAASAARALSALRTARIGAFGFHFNGITAAGLDLAMLRKRFGTEVCAFDGSSLIRRLENLDPASASYRKASALADETLTGLPAAYREKVIRMTAALSEYAEEYGLSALSVRCHTEFSMEYGLSLCLPLSLLGDTLTVACEADLPVLLTELVLHLLSGGGTSSYADVRTVTAEGLDLGACGMCPAVLTGGKIETDGAGGYLTNASPMNAGKVTLARLLKRPDGRLLMHAFSGTAKPLEAPLREYGCAAYPMTHVVLDTPAADFAEKAGANHYALIYEDLLPALRLFCRYAGIELI